MYIYIYMDDVEGHYPNTGESNGATNMEDEMEAKIFEGLESLCNVEP